MDKDAGDRVINDDDTDSKSEEDSECFENVSDEQIEVKVTSLLKRIESWKKKMEEYVH